MLFESFDEVQKEWSKVKEVMIGIEKSIRSQHPDLESHQVASVACSMPAYLSLTLLQDYLRNDWGELGGNPDDLK